MLIRQDDLLKKPVERVLKQISTLEDEQGLTRKISAARGAAKAGIPVEGKQEDKIINQQSNLEHKVDEILKNQCTFQAAAVRKRGRRVGRKQRPGPKPSDICRGCNGQGHWARTCPPLNGGKTGRGPQVQP